MYFYENSYENLGRYKNDNYKINLTTQKKTICIIYISSIYHRWKGTIGGWKEGT